jgi:hypothetical protein
MASSVVTNRTSRSAVPKQKFTAPGSSIWSSGSPAGDRTRIPPAKVA